MRGHFRSRDKDGGYINRSVVTTGAALHENKEATAKSTSQDGGMAVNFG